MYQMAEEVKRRLDNAGVKGRSITMKVMKRDPSAPIEPPKVCSSPTATFPNHLMRFNLI